MIYHEYRSIAKFSQGLPEVGLEMAARKTRESQGGRQAFAIPRIVLTVYFMAEGSHADHMILVRTIVR